MLIGLSSSFGNTSLDLRERILALDWLLILLVSAVACVGAAALYSAGNGNFDPWASRHLVRFGVGVFVMLFVALIDLRVWHRLSYAIYAGGFVLLIIVEVMGHVGMGAQRWIDLGVIKLQPSELMKIAVVMALARFYQGRTAYDSRRLFFVIPPAIMILMPVGLVLLQPDLGTALMIIMGGAAVVFLAGAPWWLFAGGIGAAIAAMPIAWQFLHEYQKNRIRTFLNPESDPLGAGYHITQSKIALGSGGLSGKGFLEGTQSHLNFLPEKQTDFIFTLWAEEWGLIGGIGLLALFGLIFIYCGWMAFRCRHTYGRLLIYGLMVNFSLYVFINCAMVMGLIPVVGAPLPLISYGGTAMLTVMIGFGLMMSAHIHKDSKLAKT